MRSTFLPFVVLSALTTSSARSLPVENSKALQKRVPASWNYHGCWTDEGDRQLGGPSYHADDMTPSTCISFCESKGFSFAGVEYSRECFCGYNLKSRSVRKEEDECNMACAGDADLKCGGPNRLNVYTSGAPTQIVTNPGPVGSGWTYKSCYEDSVYGRTLSHQVHTTPGGNSVLSCTAACRSAGYKFAGVEWSSECFRDNTINFDRASDLEGCDMVCDGNQLEYCGGAQKLNIYEFEALPVLSSTTTTTTTTTTSQVSTTTSVLSTSSSTTLQTSTTTTSSSSSTTSESSSTTTTSSSISTTTSSSSTTSQISSTTTTTVATCTPTPIVSAEQQAQDLAALNFLQENNSILKMLGKLPFKEFGDNTQTLGPTLAPIATALQNWVPCTEYSLSAKQLGCASLTNGRAFLGCIIFWTSPSAVIWSSRPNAIIPQSAITKLYNNHRNSIIPTTGEPLNTSDMDIVTYLELVRPGYGIQREGSNILYYFGESNRLW